MIKIPFLDLARLHLPLREDILRAVSDVLTSSDFISGKAVATFEQNFCEFLGVRHALALNTGTSALHLALLACGVGKGDEVITTPSTFVATTAAIVYTGATPVFVDTDPHNWTLDVNQVEAAITERTKAILPVHLHGRMCDMRKLNRIGRSNGLKLIEDACQAHGADFEGVKPGELSDAAAFSFYPGKNLGGVGEGGALVTNDDNIASHVQLLRNWGASVRYQHTIHAFNYRMDSIQGAALDIKLKFLAQWTEKRRTVAGWYFKHLAEIYGVELPARDQGHVYHVFAIRSRQRERIRGALGAASVEFGCHYPVPVHLQQAYSSFGYKSGDFPVAEQLANEWISLPMDPGMVEDDVRYVSNVIREESEKIEAS